MVTFPWRGSYWNLIVIRRFPVVGIIKCNLGRNKLEFSVEFGPELII
jgi:hypothetical protein